MWLLDVGDVTTFRNAFYLGRSGISDVQGIARRALRPCSSITTTSCPGIRVAYLSGVFAATTPARCCTPPSSVAATITRVLCFVCVGVSVFNPASHVSWWQELR